MPDNPVHADPLGDITSMLQRRGVRSARRLRVDMDAGTVTIRGTVTSFYERQLCLACCQGMSGVQRIVDRIRVR